MNVRLPFAALCLVVPCATAQAQIAAPTTGNLDVRLVVQRACEVIWPGSAEGGDALLDFGTVTRIDANIDQDIVSDASGIRVRCNNRTDFKVTLDAGMNGGGDVVNRRMRGVANTDVLVPYQLYSDVSRTTVFSTQTLTATGEYQPLPIYGRVPPLSPTPAVDTYKDRVIVTIGF